MQERENQALSGTAVGTGLQKIQGHFHLTGCAAL